MKQLIALSLILFSSLSVAESVSLPPLMSYPEARSRNINEIHKTKVLIFVSRTCPCTQQNIPYINELIKEFPNVEFFGIHSSKATTLTDISEVISIYKAEFSIIDDRELKIANILKANRTPQAIILNEKNEVIYSGGITNRTNPKNADKLYLHNALAELSKNQPITSTETRSLGCVILR